MYNIPLKKILKLSNPFIEKIEGLASKIDKKTIASKLNHVDIFEQHDSSAFENQLRKIAYHVANSKNPVIKVKIGSNSAGDHTKDNCFIVPEDDNIFLYAAAIYRGDEYINIHLESSIRDAKVLLGIELTEDAKFVNNKKKSNKAIWKLPDSEDIDWKDKNTVIQELKSRFKNYPNNSIFMNMYNHIDKSLWHDENFVKEISEITNINNIDYKDKLTLPYIQLVCNSDKYSSEFPIFIDEFILYKQNKSSYIEVMSFLDDKVFKNEASILHFIDYFNQDILEYILIDILSNENFLNAIYKKSNDFYRSGHRNSKLIDPLSYFEEKNINFFSDKSEEWKDNFVMQYPYHVLQKLTSTDDVQLSAYKKLIEHWITDPDKVVERLNGKNGIDYYNFRMYFPDNVLSYFPVSQILMDIDVRNYNNLPVEHRHNKDFIKLALEELKNNTLIPPLFLNEVTDPDIIKSLFKNNFYEKMKLLNIDDSIMYNPEYIREIAPRYASVRFKKDKKFREACETMPDYIYALVRHSDIYDKLSSKYKKDENVIIKMLASNFEKDSYDKSVLCSKDFFIKALQEKVSLITHMSPRFWEDREFVSTVFNLVDQGRINKKIIDYLPAHIGGILDYYNITSEYQSFFNNYQLNMDLKNEANQEPEKKTIKKAKI